ncbi:putative LRR receptor-like serine/threonine-protein kinase [Acorus calamus]|uniref:LRR receptor-like serine/threonine-protein kinase n=1 Tax=Acorus calamus TaxID=4465 RepID=A0AAV9DTI5_ACOCL|nr:putative LRR receptor-like serine/threonine-protein kinase [Acorus calamus]
MKLLLRVVVALCVWVVSATSQLPSQDILALLEFKKSIKHDPTGFILDSWNEESIDFDGCPSSWNGIVCNGGKVAAVVLENLGLSSEDADLGVFANLTKLLQLSLSRNSLAGRLPDNIGEFVSLKSLDLSDNLFSGTIPTGIGGLKSLQNVSLSGNKFSGPLPDSIGGLDSVESFDMSRNSFAGSVPMTISGMKNLVSLNLSFNGFTRTIPTGLEQITSLVSVDLRGNRFNGGIDWELLIRSNVVYVDLSGNSLTSLGSRELKFLSDISETVKYLNLSHNKLTGSLIDGGALSSFGNLKVLDLSHNQLTGELPGFDYVYDLEVLRLGSNGFTGFIPNGLLKGDNLVLSELDLSANNLTGRISMITSTTLRVLNLSSNAISGDLPLLTGSCTLLDLSKNQLTGNLSVLAKWGNGIEYIDLSQNQLSGTIPEGTSEFLRLNHFNLSNNILTGSLPSVLAQYPKLTVLDLSFNHFDGPLLPELLSSPTLQELHVQNNLLLGVISSPPSTTRKSQLQVLDISNNHFNGSFPDEFGSFVGLRVLDISGNNFSGPLPQAISELGALSTLDISQNFFTGPLPVTLSDTINNFNASYNDLSGVVPPNLQKFRDSSFHPGNSRLSLPNTTTGSGNSTATKSNRKTVRTVIKATVIIACVVAAVILILLAIILHYKRISRNSQSEGSMSKGIGRQSLAESATTKRSRDAGSAMVVSADELIGPRKGSSEIISLDEKMASPAKNSRVSWSPESGDSLTPENMGRLDVRSPDRLAGDLYFLDDTMVLSPEELSKAPAEVLGRSSHGTSYRATLDNGVFLTVKWLREGVAKQKKEFAKEAKKFANIRHPNVVTLRGYYWGPTQHEKLILSDYISPGSLASFLYDRPGRRGPPLTWAQRLKTAVDVARGLNYLHFDRAVPHGNLKATNILLDGPGLNARVSDYCLHRLMTQAGTAEQILDAGVLGYRAPELAASKKPQPSFKSDVYAFGVIVLELLTGRCAGDVVSGGEGGVDLTDWVRLRVAEGRGSDCFDPELAGEVGGGPAVARGMKEVLGIGLRCIRPVSERPGIKSVYEDLSSI